MAKCPKCGENAGRKGTKMERGKLVKQMKCGTCGHTFKVVSKK